MFPAQHKYMQRCGCTQEAVFSFSPNSCGTSKIEKSSRARVARERARGTPLARPLREIDFHIPIYPCLLRAGNRKARTGGRRFSRDLPWQRKSCECVCAQSQSPGICFGFSCLLRILGRFYRRGLSFFPGRVCVSQSHVAFYYCGPLCAWREMSVQSRLILLRGYAAAHILYASFGHRKEPF
jgi:hypothetical protein